MSVGAPDAASSVQDQFHAAIAAHVAGDGLTNVAVAVSGGGDSMALLALSAQLRAKLGFALSAVTVDHGLRPAAAEEAATVARFCAAHGIAHQVLDWTGWDGRGNVMAAARSARYQLIADWAQATGVQIVLLGHTQDDIAENFLIRLERKAGPDGLAAMRPRFERHGVQWCRPLLDQSRVALRGYLQAQGLSWHEDPTNEDDSFARARVRKALPGLAELGVSQDALGTVSQAMRGASDALQHYARIEARQHIRQEAGDLLIAKAPMPAEIARRLWLAAFHWFNPSAYPPRSAAMDAALARVAEGGAVTFAGCLVTQRDNLWRITREYRAVRDTRCDVHALWDGRWQLQGPKAKALRIVALGDALQDCPDWRATGLPRRSLLASPAVMQQDQLIAAPVAGFANGWRARIVADFHQWAFAH